MQTVLKDNSLTNSLESKHNGTQADFAPTLNNYREKVAPFLSGGSAGKLDIPVAAERLKSIITRTPLSFNANLSKKYACNIFLKREEFLLR